MKIQYTSGIAALFILGSQGFAAEKTQPEQKVETPILAGDSLSVNLCGNNSPTFRSIHYRP